MKMRGNWTLTFGLENQVIQVWEMLIKFSKSHRLFGFYFKGLGMKKPQEQDDFFGNTQNNPKSRGSQTGFFHLDFLLFIPRMAA
jgi:hypothetical protein